MDKKVYDYHDFVKSAEAHGYRVFDWGDKDATVSRRMIIADIHDMSDVAENNLFNSSYNREEWEQDMDDSDRFDLEEFATVRDVPNKNPDWDVTVFKFTSNSNGAYRFTKLEDILGNKKVRNCDNLIEFHDFKNVFSRYVVRVSVCPKVNPCDALFE